MTRFFCSKKLTLFLSVILLLCVLHFPSCQSLIQNYSAPKQLGWQNFWEVSVNKEENQHLQLRFQPYTFSENSLFQAVSERNCFLVSINQAPAQVILPQKDLSLSVKEGDQLHFIWLVDPQLKEKLRSEIISEQIMIVKDGTLGDRLHFIRLVDPQLKEKLRSEIIREQIMIVKDGTLKEVQP